MIQIKRGETNLLQIEPSRSSVHQKAVMADDKVTLSWEQAFVTHLNLGDYILHDGLRYKLNTLPTIKKLSTKLFQYDAIFEAPQYDLLKVAYMFLDGNIPEGEFTMTANAGMFMDLLILNLQRVYPDGNWTKGQVIADSEYITLTFSFENCMSVLQRLASEFNTEFSFSGYQVNLNKVTTERLVTLQYKRTSPVVSGEEADAMADNANLYDIERLSVDSSNVVTRLYPFGSSKNLSSDYRRGAARLTVPYIDSPNAAVFGIIEATKSFDDIFPRLELTGAGVITAIGADEFTFVDDEINFDVNDHLLDSVPAKVKFLTGQCAGYECEIKSFDYGTHTFVIIQNATETDFKIPNSELKPAVDNKYVLLDVRMPDEYIEMAEEELTAEGTKYLITDGNDSVKVSYRVRFSSIYAKLHPQALEVSDTVTVYDPDIAVNEPIRITRITRNMAVLSEVDIELSNSISVGTLDRITSDVSELKNTAVTTEVEIRKNSLAGYRNAKELREMVFDPDGYFDTDNIRPASIETGMLSVGTRSQSFQLTCSVNANTGANPQLFSWSAGALAHFTIADTIKIWTIPSGSITLTGGNTSVALYIYARCSRTTTDAVLYLDATAIKFDADADYWYFLVGVLHSPISGVRGISLTYGQTIINGQFIQTGVIRSIDGLTYFDLNNGEIGGNIKFKSGQTPEDLEDDIDNLYAEIAGFGSDGIITPAEKRELKIQWDEIAYEFQPLYDQGDALSCASFESFGDAYSALYSYLFVNPNLLNPANMGIDSTIVPSAYKLVWANFFKFRAALRTEIAAAINVLVDIVASDGVLTPAEKLQLKSMWDGMVADHGKVVRRATAAGITALTVYTTFVSKYNTLVAYLNPIFANMSANSTIVPATFKTNFSDYATAKAEVEKYLDEYDEQTIASMIANIDNLYAEIAGFGSDGIITPAEKRELKIQWDEIAYEFQDLYDQGELLRCVSFDIFADYYSDLYYYLFVNPNLLNPANMGIDSTIVPSAYKLVWADFLKSRATLRTEIAAAINALVDMAISDGVLTPAEKLQLKSMWDGMVADHGKVVRRATAAGITALTVYTTFVSKCNTLTTYLNAIFTSMTTNSTIVPATFKTNFSDYATAKADVEKYLDEYDEQNVTAMIANIDKAISDSWITPSEQRGLRIQWDTIEGEIGSLYNQANNLGCASTSNYYTAYTTLKNYISSIGLFVNMSASVYIANVTTFRAYWIAYYQNKEIILSEINEKLGIKASAADYLRTAMQGSTDISGGLLLTNLLLMKSTSGLIQGGMSGILADIIGMWTGGTYDQAQAGTANVILYKNGTAKIGIFKVYADRIEVDLPYGKLKFDGTGLYLLDANSNKKVEIYSGNIPTLASIVGEGSQLSVPAQSLNATFVNETVLTNFGGQFSLAKASNKITMSVNATIKFTFAGSNVGLYWRIRNTGTNEIIMWGSPIIYTTGELGTTKNISLSTSIYDKPAGTYQLELRIYTGGGTSFTYNKLEIASGYVNYQVISPRTIIGANGMASIYSNSEYFHVEKNVGDKMRIRLSGDVQINGTNY